MAQIFPRWTNDAPRTTLYALLIGSVLLTFAVWYWASPKHTDVGYAPKQPIEYSHKVHAGDLGIDCRYCHMYVERGPYAGVPPTSVCMNCHAQVRKDSEKLAALRESWTQGTPVPWKRIHKLPDFSYFDHSAHVGVGFGQNRAAIGCESCHGRIDTMEVVRQVQPLSMSWCVDCHSNTAPHLRPTTALTKMGWLPDSEWQTSRAPQIAESLSPPYDLSRAQVRKADGTVVTYATAGCSGCHR